jgi:hypothetical protein
MKLNDKTIINGLVFCLLLLFAFYIGRDCGCSENYREIERKYSEIIEIADKEARKSYKDTDFTNERWYDLQYCNATYNNWMHDCQDWEDIFYEKTPQCSKFKNDMKRGDPDRTYFY